MLAAQNALLLPQHQLCRSRRGIVLILVDACGLAVLVLAAVAFRNAARKGLRPRRAVAARPGRLQRRRNALARRAAATAAAISNSRIKRLGLLLQLWLRRLRRKERRHDGCFVRASRGLVLGGSLSQGEAGVSGGGDEAAAAATGRGAALTARMRWMSSQSRFLSSSSWICSWSAAPCARSTFASACGVVMPCAVKCGIA